jgi:undecaprenyl-diphosphatase
MHQLLDLIFLIDFHLVQSAVDWTFASPSHTGVVFVVAELALYVYPLVLLAFFESPERIRGDRMGKKKAAVLALFSVLLGLATKAVLSVWLFRDRPFQAITDLQHLSVQVDQNSFPSNHAMIAAAIAASLLASGYRKTGSLMLIGAACIGAARVYAGVHFPSDVLMGWLIGVGCAYYFHRESSSLRRYLPDR